MKSNLGSSDGAITLSVSGGTSPYTYVWSTGQTTAGITGLTSGTYDVTVTDDNNCTETASFIVDALAVSPIAISYTTTGTCYGVAEGAIDITVTGGVLPYSYLWISNDGYSIPNPGAEDQTDLLGGTYKVKVTDAVGTIELETIVVTENPKITATTSATPASMPYGCSCFEAEVIAAGGTPTYTYAWSDGQTGSPITGCPENPTGGAITDPISIPYYVTVTDMVGCTVKVSVSVDREPIIHQLDEYALLSFGGCNYASEILMNATNTIHDPIGTLTDQGNVVLTGSQNTFNDYIVAGSLVENVTPNTYGTTYLGTSHPGNPLAILPPACSCSVAACTTTVADGATVTLSPGCHCFVEVGVASRLFLEPGVHHFQGLLAKDRSVVRSTTFDPADVLMVVEDDLTLKNYVSFISTSYTLGTFGGASYNVVKGQQLACRIKFNSNNTFFRKSRYCWEDILCPSTKSNGETYTTEFEVDPMVKLFPNPNSGSFTVVADFENDEVTTLEVIDMLGQVVYKDEIPQGGLLRFFLKDLLLVCMLYAFTTQDGPSLNKW